MKLIERFKRLPPSFVWIFLLAISAPFWGLTHPLIEVDDARYAEVPREMLVLGNWATPKLDYFDYVEKPPLGYWMDILSYKIFGVSAGASRVPTALLSVLGILGIFWTGAWLFDFETGFLAALFLSSGLLYFFLSHYITPDLPLTFFLFGAFSLILRTLLRPEDARWASPGAWVFSAAAFLAKGLIGLVFPGGWAILCAIFIPSVRKNFSRLFKISGPLLFLALVGPWFWVMGKSHPGFFKFFFWDQHVLRFLTLNYGRQQPWYFFILVFPLALLPWTPLALSGLWKGLKEFKEEKPETLLAFWIVMITAFFSISHSKLITYILPVIPQACLLAAHEFKKPLPAWARKIAWFLSGAFITAAIAGAALSRAPFAQKYIPAGLPRTGQNAVSAAAILILWAAALWSLSFEKDSALNLEDSASRPKIPAKLWKPLLCSWLIGLLGLSAFEFDSNALSAKSLCSFIQKNEKPQDLVYSYGIYLQGVPFYLRRPVDKILNWTGELAYARSFKGNASRFGGDSSLKELPIQGKQVFVILQKRDLAHALKLLNAKKMRGNRLFFSGPWACLDVY